MAVPLALEDALGGAMQLYDETGDKEALKANLDAIE